MDKVLWPEAKLQSRLRSILGIEKAIFVSIDSTGKDITNQIVDRSVEPLVVDISSKKFLKYFNIEDSDLHTLSKVREHFKFDSVPIVRV